MRSIVPVVILCATAARAEEPTPPAPPPRDLTVSADGLFRPGLLLQGWLFAEHAAADTVTFRLRRAEIHLKGDVIPGLFGYAVMIDPAKVLELTPVTTSVSGATGTVTTPQPASGLISVLQDFYITYKSPYADVSLGQFKIPVSWEGTNSSAKLLFPERATVSRTFGDRRDLGLRVAKTFKYVGFSAGLFNGAGANNLDTNTAKDGALRLEVYPIEGLTLAGVAYASLAERHQAFAKERWEADVRYERGPFLLQSELIRGSDRDKAGKASTGQGFYAALAYKVTTEIQPAVRFGALDPHVHVDNDALWQLDAGLNYYIRGHDAKLQLAYSHFQFRAPGKKPADQGTLAAQVAF